MITFQNEVVEKTVDRLLKGDDYREEVVNSINAVFFDFTLDFFKKIVEAKMSDETITLEWYKKYFINGDSFSPEEAAIYAGINKKTINNMYGTTAREVVLSVANDNFEYLRSIVGQLEKDALNEIAINIKISYKNITVDLTLTESLLVINALATKKIQLRGGAWSSIGKKVEKPLLDRLCNILEVPTNNIDNSNFIQDKSKKFDREVDYRLISSSGKIYRIEVKLMGKGNPESADATIARDSDIFIADTLSEQNCNQLEFRGIEYLILKGNKNIIEDFRNILDKLDIPHKK
ncbi:CfrBI family restriction endonuclease [uncultured Tyzzerella sp.]|uniref:CfrBI family restriction endonuclease n=1 Tax=uncultured Tyzzerella sp. TaxID=2321398 RepID=UPI0029433DE6|nr:CfrBI family restriction endonuclease [uncultured Tyzzerella sp.]